MSSGRTITRLSSDSPEEQGAMAMPSIIMAESGERIAIADGDTAEASEDASTPMIIVDAVMKSLSSSLAASGVMGATGSSDSRESHGLLFGRLLIDQIGVLQILRRRGGHVRAESVLLLPRHQEALHSPRVRLFR